MIFISDSVSASELLFKNKLLDNKENFPETTTEKILCPIVPFHIFFSHSMNLIKLKI